MSMFTVDYHGSMTDRHARYAARPERTCPQGHDHDDGWLPDPRLILSDPATGEDVLTCVRGVSVTRIAPDGRPFNVPAVEGDLVMLASGALVIFAEQEPAHRYGSDRCAQVSYYSRSGGRWYISSRVMDLGGGRICRARYSTPRERRTRLLNLDREDRITYLRDVRERPDAWYYEREADALERVAQALDGLSLTD